MKPSPNKIDPLVEEKLALLRPVPSRDPAIARRGRANFLARARSMAPAVSEISQRRRNGWNMALKPMLNRKELSPMLATLTSVLLVVSILLGGTGVTVYAAQDSLPDQPLYVLKTFTEDLRLRLSNSEQAQLNLDLEFAGRRVQEMIALSLAGDSPADAVLERLELHLNHAFQHAADLDDNNFPPAAERIRQQLQVQEHKLTQAREQAGKAARAQLTRAREMVQLRLRLVEEGLHNPLALRERLRDQEHLRLHTGTETSPGGEHQGPHQTQTGSGYGSGPVLTDEPASGSGHGPGPGPEETAQPGSGYGPGPQVTASPERGEGYGPGPKTNQQIQTGKGDGSGPHPTEDPGGHQSGGSHPADDSGNHHGPGPQPTEDSGGQGGPAPQEAQPMGSGGGGQGGRP